MSSESTCSSIRQAVDPLLTLQIQQTPHRLCVDRGVCVFTESDCLLQAVAQWQGFVGSVPHRVLKVLAELAERLQVKQHK